jgi:predicted transcriptional regulator
MLTKEKLMDSIKDFPSEFSIDELVERLVFVQKIEDGIAQGERGETYTTEELKGKLAKWLR